MCYINIRLLILAVISVLLFSRAKTRGFFTRAALIRGLTIISIFVILELIPFENAFYSFPSIEAAEKYSSSDKLISVADGKNSAFLIKKNAQNTIVFEQLPRSGSGWKLGSVFSEREWYKFADTKGKFLVLVFISRFAKESFVIVRHLIGIDEFG